MFYCICCSLIPELCGPLNESHNCESCQETVELEEKAIEADVSVTVAGLNPREKVVICERTQGSHTQSR